MSSLEAQSLGRRSRLDDLRNRKKRKQEGVGLSEDSVVKSDEASAFKAEFRNYNQDTNLPVNAFTSELLKMELDGETVEVVSAEIENHILSQLSQKYKLNDDDNETPNKPKTRSEFDKDMEDYQKILEKRTIKAVRRLLKQRLAKN